MRDIFEITGGRLRAAAGFFGGGGAARDGLLTTAAAGEAYDLSLWAKGKGKRKRKRKAAPKEKPPAKKKAQPKPAVARKRKPKQLSSNWLERGINNLFAWWDSQGYGWRDYFRMALLAGGLLVVLYYSFSAGGYFVVKRSYGELVVLYMLILGLLFGLRAEGKLPRLGWLEIGFFGAYAAWTLLSVSWSIIPARSLDEFIRASLYLGGYGLFYLYLARREWLGWLGHVFIIIVFIVALDSMFGKIGIIDHPDPFEQNRLSYPLTYWNTVGLLMIMAFPISLRVLADRGTHVVVRCLYAPALVLFLSVLFFTFSRAGLLLLMLMFGLYLVVAVSRMRAVMQAAIAVFWTAVLVGFCYMFLPTMVQLIPNPDEGEARSLGFLLIFVLLSAVGSQVAVWYQEKKITVSEESARKIGYALAGAVVGLLLLVSIVFFAQRGGPVTWVRTQIDVIAEPETVVLGAEERLLSLQSERYNEYRVSVGVLADNPLKGTGAGTWSVHWFKERDREIQVKDGHSWLFENMAELGLVGTFLMVAFLVTFFIRCVSDLRFIGRSRQREVYGAFFVACTTFIIHSIIDWDWEMAIVTLSFFMFAGGLLRYGALSRAAAEGDAAAEPSPVSHGTGTEGWNPKRLLSWNWLIGLLCVLLMVLTAFPLIAENRILSAARLAQEGQDFATVGKRAESAAAFNPLDGEAFVLQAISAQSQGDLEEAERLILKAMELEPYNDKFYRNLARVSLARYELSSTPEEREKFKEGAVAAIKKSRELNPLESADTGSLEQEIRQQTGAGI